MWVLTGNKSTFSENFLVDYDFDSSFGLLVHKNVDKKQFERLSKRDLGKGNVIDILNSYREAAKFNPAYPVVLGDLSLEDAIEATVDEDFKKSLANDNEFKVLTFFKMGRNVAVSYLEDAPRKEFDYVVNIYTERIRNISDGIVIDHLEVGAAAEIYTKIIEEMYPNEVCTWSSGLPSIKYGQKDVIKLRGVFPDSNTLTAIAVLSPKTTPTLSTIRNYEIESKNSILIDKEVSGILKCENNNCVTNSSDFLKTGRKNRFFPYKNGNKIGCHYCGRIYNIRQE